MNHDVIKNVPAEYTITPEAAEAAGCVTYWRVSGDVNIDVFAKAWVAAGLDTKLLRKEPEPATALRRAVLSLQARRPIGETKELRTLVRPQAEPHSWAIVEEIVEEGKIPSYSTRFVVSYTNGAPKVEPIVALGNDGEITTVTDRIKSAFHSQSGLYATEDITGWLVKLAYANGAVTLRDSGGVYFIPRPAMEFWHKAAFVLETVTGQAHRVFRIPAMKNAEAVAAIVDAVQAEAAQIIEQIESDLATDDKLGVRAIKTRQKDLVALADKLVSYEKLLGLQLDVGARVVGLQSNLTLAALAADEGAAS